MHQCGRFGDDDRPLGIALEFPGLEAFFGRGQLFFELLVGQFIELLEELAGGGIEALVGHGLVLSNVVVDRDCANDQSVY